MAFILKSECSEKKGIYMTNAEKISKKENELKKINERIKNYQAKVEKLQKEITELENFEIQSMIKNLNMPVSEVKSLLQDLMGVTQTDPEAKQ